MLAISPLRSRNDDERGGESAGDFSALGSGGADNFSGDFSAGDLLESIDFDDLFVGFDDGDTLPDLELDPTEMLAEFSVGGGEDSGTTTASRSTGDQDLERADESEKREAEEDEKQSSNTDGAAPNDDGVAVSAGSSSSPETDKGRKSSASQAKSTQGKRKMKVGIHHQGKKPSAGLPPLVRSINKPTRWRRRSAFITIRIKTRKIYGFIA